MPMKSFWILIVVVMIVAGLFVELAGIPGVVARRRGHPQAKAIKVLGWCGLPMGIARVSYTHVKWQPNREG